jgi:hypothetical protein
VKAGLSSSTTDLETQLEMSKKKNILTGYSLSLKIKDFDASGGGSTQPVSVGGEDESVYNVTGLQRVQVLALVQVPEHGDTILSARGSKRTVRGDGDGVDITGVSVVVGLELELGEFPNLKEKQY